jgi:Ca-activated chloride channel family protein
VKLDPADRIPNKDFVLRYRVAGERGEINLITSRDERGRIFHAHAVPAAGSARAQASAPRTCFVLDCSGSMSGRPLAQAKAAIERALQRLQPGDSFQLINFSVEARKFGPRPIEATAANRQRGLAYLRSLDSEGGTMMIEGIKAALDFPHDPERLRSCVSSLTVSSATTMTSCGKCSISLGASRIFSFGVGSAPNRYLLHHMAKLGRGGGGLPWAQPRRGAGDGDFFDRISHPALADVAARMGRAQG